MDITQLSANVYLSGCVCMWPPLVPSPDSSSMCLVSPSHQTPDTVPLLAKAPITHSLPPPPYWKPLLKLPSALPFLTNHSRNDSESRWQETEECLGSIPILTASHTPNQFTLVKGTELGKPSHAWGRVTTTQSVPILWDSSSGCHLLSMNPMPER